MFVSLTAARHGLHRHSHYCFSSDSSIGFLVGLPHCCGLWQIFYPHLSWRYFSFKCFSNKIVTFVAIYPKRRVVYRSMSYFPLQETSAKPCGALDILIAVNASQLKTFWNCLFLYNIVFIAKWVLKGACPWVAPRTSRTRSENHTTRPTGRPLWYQL